MPATLDCIPLLSLTFLPILVRQFKPWESVVAAPIFHRRDIGNCRCRGAFGPHRFRLVEGFCRPRIAERRRNVGFAIAIACPWGSEGDAMSEALKQCVNFKGALDCARTLPVRTEFRE